MEWETGCRYEESDYGMLVLTIIVPYNAVGRDRMSWAKVVLLAPLLNNLRRDT